MPGSKNHKNQEKIRRRLYRKVSHRGRGGARAYESLRLRRERAGAEEFRKLLAGY